MRWSRAAEHAAETRGRLIDELNRTVALVEQQRQEIWNLSAPILDVGAGTAAMPLIGNLSPARIAEITGRLLATVQGDRRRFVILDLTGVAEVESSAARSLLSLISALELLGAQAILTGIRSNLAQALVSVNLESSRLLTLRSLHDGLEYCRHKMGSK